MKSAAKFTLDAPFVMFQLKVSIYGVKVAHMVDTSIICLSGLRIITCVLQDVVTSAKSDWLSNY